MLPEIEKLAEIKEREHLSCDKIAREMGVTAGSVWRWLKGQRPIDAMMYQIRLFIRRHDDGQTKKSKNARVGK